MTKKKKKIAPKKEGSAKKDKKKNETAPIEFGKALDIIIQKGIQKS